MDTDLTLTQHDWDAIASRKPRVARDSSDANRGWYICLDPGVGRVYLDTSGKAGITARYDCFWRSDEAATGFLAMWEKATSRVKQLEDMLFKRGAMSTAPCFCCGFNGEGYYQSDKHPCAQRHHDLSET